ncbi:MAG: formate dehydrogenase accessory sulfurtransferase FdhD [Deltaproteobacteria bacterium]|nr:formate dehydrogenase accessory sulfurtransferase FdhD [Deltaproteobacteria bacterium]
MAIVSSYRNGKLESTQAEVVREHSLKIVVNRREIATLVCSPHDLGFLAAGFLRQQGFIETAEDLLQLGVCADSGVASASIKGEVPEIAPRVITSSCGAAPGASVGPHAGFPSKRIGAPIRSFRPSEIFGRMEDLYRLAVNYKTHGGMHSSAVGDGSSVLLYAEDLGRHNTLDRIAGEALMKHIDLAGKMLVTSGRVPSETVAKAASLGIDCIASRTSPTDAAVSMASALGVTLIGYVRGSRFTVYTHPERVSVPVAESRIRGITGVILAGGASRRMGSNKALLPHQGGRFIESVHRCLEEVFEETLIVTNTPEAYGFLPCRKVRDLLTGMGVLSGIHSGLCHSEDPRIFVVACDMPNLYPGLIRHLALQSEGSDVLVPESDKGLEPLHAVFHKECIPSIEDALRAGERRIVSFFDKVKVRKVGMDEVARFDPEFRSFRNINTPEDYYRLRDGGNIATAEGAPGMNSRNDAAKRG